jgi:hypothetical protein
VWINVAEALPARDTDVLVYLAQHRQIAVGQWDGQAWNLVDFDLDDQEWYVFEVPAPVTHSGRRCPRRRA